MANKGKILVLLICSPLLAGVLLGATAKREREIIFSLSWDSGAIAEVGQIDGRQAGVQRGPVAFGVRPHVVDGDTVRFDITDLSDSDLPLADRLRMPGTYIESVVVRRGELGDSQLTGLQLGFMRTRMVR